MLWIFCLNICYGTHTHCGSMKWIYGKNIWEEYMGWIYGMNICDEYMERILNIRQGCMRWISEARFTMNAMNVRREVKAYCLNFSSMNTMINTMPSWAEHMYLLLVNIYVIFLCVFGSRGFYKLSLNAY